MDLLDLVTENGEINFSNRIGSLWQFFPSALPWTLFILYPKNLDMTAL